MRQFKFRVNIDGFRSIEHIVSASCESDAKAIVESLFPNHKGIGLLA